MVSLRQEALAFLWRTPNSVPGMLFRLCRAYCFCTNQQLACSVVCARASPSRLRANTKSAPRSGFGAKFGPIRSHPGVWGSRGCKPDRAAELGWGNPSPQPSPVGASFGHHNSNGEWESVGKDLENGDRASPCADCGLTFLARSIDATERSARSLLLGAELLFQDIIRSFASLWLPGTPVYGFVQF